MPSFSDSIVLFILALLLFGPKKLPVLARELGKWLGEFRRASNEFKMQMEEELRASEQEDRQKQIAAMEAAAPAASVPEPEHPHLSDRPSAETVHAKNTPERLPIATSGELNLMPPATGLPVARGRHEDSTAGIASEAEDHPSSSNVHGDATQEAVSHAS